MRGSQRNIHTIYHVMEAAGKFDENPANPTARNEEGLSIYKGPVEFPKMLYHPEGQERILVPGELILSPGGREMKVGEIRELVWKIVQDREEEAELLALGWHRTPAQAIAAANDPSRPVPPESPAQVLNAKDQEIQELREQLEKLKKTKPAAAGASA